MCTITYALLAEKHDMNICSVGCGLFTQRTDQNPTNVEN